MIKYGRGTILLSLAAILSVAVSSAAVIGVATTDGSMLVDANSVRGTANVSDGSTVRTDATSGQIAFQNGARAVLGQKTAASVFANHIEIREGVGQVSGRQGFEMQALGFSISPETTRSIARVSYERPDRILVTAVDSAVKVTKNGVLLAELRPGTTYFFEAGAAESSGVAQTAAKTAGKATGKAASTVAKAGMSGAAKWGIVAGAAAAATGVGVGVTRNDASR